MPRRIHPLNAASWSAIACLMLATSLPAQVRDSSADRGAAALFAGNDVLSVRIEAPLTTLMRERPEVQYLPATFVLLRGDGSEQSFDLKLRARGKYRLQEDHCDFAPLRLNFRKRQLDNTELAGQDKLKLVTHCRTNSIRYEQLVYREYLAYRLLNVLTPKSYRVRLLLIEYIDTESDESIKKPGFVIEEDDAVAARNGMVVVKTDDILSSNLDRRQQNLVNLFQYMIGNTEYSLFKSEPNDDCCHNSDLLSETGGAPYTPLPYDFDFAGIVNAPYAESNPRYNLRNVRKRLYKGHCDNNDLLPETAQRFLEARDAVFGTVDDLQLLSRISRRGVVAYLDRFYDYISTPKSLEARLANKCVEPK